MDALNARNEGDKAPNRVACDGIQDKFRTTLQMLEDMTLRADDIQRGLLEEILTRNSKVEYLQRHGLHGRTDRETFKRVIPVVTYEDILPEILRIANGDSSNVLSCEPIYQIITSSGTTGGESKLFPISEEDLCRRAKMLGLGTSVVSQFVDDIDKGKALYFYFSSPGFTTPGGINAAPLSTIMLNSPIYKNKEPDPSNDLTSPIETVICTDFFQSIYSQMLCGLFQSRQVIRIGAFFAAILVYAVKFLENHWKLLVDDIRNGTVNSLVTYQSVRQSVMKIIKPDPKLAELIETECEKQSWQGIIPRLWPFTKYLDAIATGSESQYIRSLDYYSNHLPLFSFYYGCSECNFGINLTPTCKPKEASYTLIPSMAYFEFLPIRSNGGDSNPDLDTMASNDGNELVDLTEVVIGREYEPVVTTYMGLYRYRVGDVIRVSGFKNKAPQFNFVRRAKVVLSIDADKTNEAELQTAVDNVVGHLASIHATIDDYTSYADSSTFPGHYVLFWEVACEDSTPITPSLLVECCSIVEDSLSRVYKFCRFHGTIDPLEVKIVEPGTFSKLMHQAVSLRASVSQYKTPRTLTSAAQIELMNAGVVSSYFSPSCPKCVPGYSGWNY